MTPAIEAADLRFGFGGEPVLDGVDLTVEPGTFVGLTGPNGAGKSTLLKLSVGLLRPSSGTLRVLGADPLDAAVRRKVGYASQGSPTRVVLPISVSEVVEAGMTRGRGVVRRPRVSERALVERAIDAVGLGKLAAECVFELSGGQQQRAAIARALVGDPPLLLLDEPTTGIDRAFRPQLVEDLRRRADGGAAVVVVSHDPDDFHDETDRILFLEDGRLRDVAHEEYHGASQR
ncbi:MAG TPA: metal ABC transporter ATP-binding protein [Actinomycetota bacterium]|nr:metal ABC transporter ATP-binding protein [Actinomycetota bacterium]